MAEFYGGSGRVDYGSVSSKRPTRVRSSRRAHGDKLPSESRISARDEFQEILEMRNSGLSQRVNALESSIQSLHQNSHVVNVRLNTI